VPFASVVVPTRNRPAFVRQALQSLREQTFADFEVIVVDNHTGQPAREVFDELAAPHFRYVQPERPLPMHENWELGVGLAQGDYVIVLIDKTILLPSALEALRRLTARETPDIVTWRDDGYNLIPGDGFKVYTPNALGVQRPEPYAPLDELATKVGFDVRRGDAEGAHYYRGKICFGAYHHSLIGRIKDDLGRLFHPLAPDYTSMIAALSHARSALDAGMPLTISAATTISTGARCATDPGAVRDFILEIDPTGRILDDLPIAGLYASQHNFVAHDYVSMRRRLGERMATPPLDRVNLVLRALEDLHLVEWPDPAERRVQVALWRDAFDAFPAAERVRILLAYARYLRSVSIDRARHSLEEIFKSSLPRTAGLAKKVLRRGRRLVGVGGSERPVARTCETIQEAARSADAVYRPLAQC
jgi:glycosyltransferase involved in cell wall biosynthesis